MISILLALQRKLKIYELVIIKFKTELISNIDNVINENCLSIITLVKIKNLEFIMILSTYHEII